MHETRTRGRGREVCKLVCVANRPDGIGGGRCRRGGRAGACCGDGACCCSSTPSSPRSSSPARPPSRPACHHGLCQAGCAAPAPPCFRWPVCPGRWLHAGAAAAAQAVAPRGGQARQQEAAQAVAGRAGRQPRHARRQVQPRPLPEAHDGLWLAPDGVRHAHGAPGHQDQQAGRRRGPAAAGGARRKRRVDPGRAFDHPPRHPPRAPYRPQEDDVSSSGRKDQEASSAAAASADMAALKQQLSQLMRMQEENAK